jgi:hypothetical protein
MSSIKAYGALHFPTSARVNVGNVGAADGAAVGDPVGVFVGTDVGV